MPQSLSTMKSQNDFLMITTPAMNNSDKPVSFNIIAPL